MGFFGCSFLTISQFVFYLLQMAPIVIYFTLVEREGIYFMEYFLFYMTIFIKMIIVGIRYSFMNEERMYMMKNSLMDMKVL